MRSSLRLRARLCGSVTAALLGLLPACGDDTGTPAMPAHTDDGGVHCHGSDCAVIDAGVRMVPALEASTALPVTDAGFAWNLPKGFSETPAVPADNPITSEKVELGRHVFYDTRLSDNQTFSCASCHKQELAFSDGRAVGLGSTGQSHTRSSMSLANVGYSPTLTWANPLMTTLERQAQVPIFGDAPIELGMKSIGQVEARLRAIPRYQALFAAAFPGEADPINMANVQRALASFQRTLISGNSPFDRWQFHGDSDAVSDSAKRGFALFSSEKLECFHCHLGFNFTDHVSYAGQSFTTAPYHNTGLYNVDGLGGYPAPNTGTHEVTMLERDMGMFKAPTLRNIALTAPYMHDGSIATLSDVLDHYAKRGRANSFRTDALLIGFTLSDQERADMIAFLESLTDQEFITNPAFSNPWPAEPPQPVVP
jgi:cytochrome c peroxidase